ncbi:MAG: hypothetical protein K8J31_11500 [Anaerolineae bacterium]|nr:hypothetical protein [Anaerolineae bacterium]
MASRRTPLFLTALILISLLWMMIQSGPLKGSTAALVLAVLAQVYLPGYLLARALGKHRLPHPIMRWMWVLACGLAPTIILGAIFRLFNVPVAVYGVVLHGLMLGLAWRPTGPAPDAPAWRWTWDKLPLYGVVLAACVVVLAVSSASRYRFFGFEDQVIFVSQAGWLANNISETPNGLPLRARQVAVLNGDTRFDTDGWTYNHAVWSWASGVSTAQIIWFDLNPLFLWAVPLAMFALVYELTRREQAAAWSAAALALVGLLLLDSIAHYPGYTTYGRLAVFQINTLRQMSIALMLPLTLMIGFAYLRGRQRRGLFMIALVGAALAILHPIQISLFVFSIGVTVALHWLVSPGRKTALVRWIPLGLVLVFLLALPFVQRLNRAGLGAADTLIRDEAVADVEEVSTQGWFLLLPNLPVVGSTFIRNPASVFYHPVIGLVIVLGLLYALGIRRSWAAQYGFGATAVFLLLSFTPGLTEWFNKFASSVGLLTTFFILPIPLILGLSLDHALRWLESRWKVYPAWLVSVILMAAGALLLFEPVPIPASARDQIQSFNEMQGFRRLRPAQTALTARLQMLLPANQTTILMTPPDTTSVAIEDLPRVLVTGGRRNRNLANAADNRFYNIYGTTAPWLDRDDLEFMTRWGVTHLVSLADHTRLPQLVMQPERFPYLDTVEGQWIFGRRADLTPDAIDDLFARMNAAYPEDPAPRWSAAGFEMARPGSTEIWEPLADSWQALLDSQPDSDRARLGLAYADLMRGADSQALPLWAQLHAAYPDLAPLTDALAYTQAALGRPEAGAEVLLAALDSDRPEARVLAVRTLLSDSFFYLLDSEQQDRLLGVVAADSETWDYLAVFDRPDETRRQAALWLSAQRWQTAIDWLDTLPAMMISPRDLVAQAAAALAQGDIQAALDRLRPAADPDWRAAKAFWGPDRWADNQAERMDYLLSGDVALREGRAQDAAAAYQQAADAGAGLAADYFLAQALDQAGQGERAAQMRAAYEADWPQGVSELVPLGAIAEAGNPFVLQPEVIQDEANHSLTVTATYGDFQPQRGYPVAFWRIEVISPDAATRYAMVDVPAVSIENALVRVSTPVELPADLDRLTPALVIITPAHSSTVTYASAIVPVTLNRPDSAALPADVEPLGLRFGESITLEHYTLEVHEDALDLTLYWQTEAPLAENDQVFVHVLDADGQIIAQDDSAPAQGRYPTGQWRSGVIIADAHHIPLEAASDVAAVRIGLYHLPEGTRLPITDADGQPQGDSVTIGVS